MKLEEPEHKDSWEIRLFHNFNLPLFFPRQRSIAVQSVIESILFTVPSLLLS